MRADLLNIVELTTPLFIASRLTSTWSPRLRWRCDASSHRFAEAIRTEVITSPVSNGLATQPDR